MDSELKFPSKDVDDFGCDYSLEASSSDLWYRTVKRNYKAFMSSSDSSSNAKLLLENQCAALLEALSSQKETVKDLQLELEEERSAAASAANETMSMILRLQREKAEIQMEARQFKVFAEEKMIHDQAKLSALEDLLYEKEQAIQALTYEVEAYKHRLLSYGLTEAEIRDQILGFGRDSSVVSIDVYPCEYSSLDENPSVPDGQSPRWPYYDPNSPLGTAKDIKGTVFAASPLSNSSDKVSTFDEPRKLNGDHWNSPRYQEPVMTPQGVNEPDIKKLYTKLQALETDKESLRQIILSMRTDKAQLVLLKEIAQHLTKETGITNRRNPVSKRQSFKTLSLATLFKWIVSLVSWKRKAKRNKYVHDLSANNMGALMILGDGSRARRWSCLTSSHV